MKQTSLLLFLWGSAFVAVVAAVAMLYLSYVGVRTSQQEHPLSDEDIARNKVTIVQAIHDAGVDYLQASGGFWYQREDGSLFKYNPDIYAQEGLSDTQLAALVRDVKGSTLYNKEDLHAVAQSDLPTAVQFHNALYVPGGVGNTYALIASLEKGIQDHTYTKDSLEQLAHVYEQVGKYDMRDHTYSILCKEFSLYCTAAVTVSVRGMVVDSQHQPIAGALVEAASKPDAKKVTTDIDGKYVLTLGVSELEKIRIKASKRNFSDGIVNLQIATVRRDTYEVGDIVLSSPLSVVSIDTKDKKITGEHNSILSDGTYVVTTPQSEYRIPKDAIRRRDGSLYEGLVDVYLYEFTKDTVPESLVGVDTFDEVMGYAGDLMKTFGMPYIQFFSQDGEELHVFSSNPMVLTYHIYHMQALYNASDHIYPPLTDADMQLLQDVSAGGGYPINREFLIKSGLLRFPAFWVFDQARGIWDNVGVDVVDKSGVIRSIFYTIKSN